MCRCKARITKKIDELKRTSLTNKENETNQTE